MSRLRATDSADLILETLEVRSIRLSSNPDLAEYAAHCDATIAQVEGKQKAYRRAVAARMAATLVIRRRDRALNKVFMLFARAVAAVTNGHREAAEHKAFFHKNPSEIIRPIGGEGQAQDVELVLQALESHPLGEPFRAQHAGPVRAHLDALVEAENQRKALYLAEAAAHIALRATLDQAIAFHNGLQTQLMVIFKDDEDEVNAYLA